MTKYLTSKDIARIAGVSQTTVSLVLRNKWEGRVRESVAKHVKQICEENNYRTNHVARILKSGHSNTIALVVPDSENPFFSEILHSITQLSNKDGDFCLLIETNNNPAWYSYIEDSILGKAIDIAIICYNNLPKRNPLVDKKIIFLNDYHLNTNSISIDFRKAAEEAVSLLHSHGYRHMVHVCGSIVKETFTARREGFTKACDSMGIFHSEIISHGYTNNNIYEQLLNLHDKYTYPLAFFVDDDLLTYGIYRFANEKNLVIGKDIGIISMDDTLLCRCYSPYLSSYGYDVQKLSLKIIEMITSMRKGEMDQQHVTFEMKLNEGSSF